MLINELVCIEGLFLSWRSVFFVHFGGKLFSAKPWKCI